MRIAFGLGLLSATLLLSGCFFHRAANHPAAPVAVQRPEPVIQPDLHATGKIAMVNTEAGFVIVSFPPGTMPVTGQYLDIYRNGLKVGGIKVTGPQRENDTAADIVTGDIRVHDEARAE